MGPICNPRWKQKRTEGYVIVSSFTYIDIFWFIKSLLTYTDSNFCFYVEVNFWDVVPYEISLHYPHNIKSIEYCTSLEQIYDLPITFSSPDEQSVQWVIDGTFVTLFVVTTMAQDFCFHFF